MVAKIDFIELLKEPNLISHRLGSLLQEIVDDENQQNDQQ